MKYLFFDKVKNEFCKMAEAGNRFEVCIQKKSELNKNKLDDLALLLKLNINLCEQQVHFRVYEQKFRLKDKRTVFHYLFSGYLT